MVCFAVLPDVHLGRVKAFLNWWDHFIPYSKDEVVGVEIEERLRKFVEKINNSPEIEFVISIGDFTDTATKEQFKAVREIIKNLRVPLIPSMGNHDVWPYERDDSGKVIWNAKGPMTFSEFKKFFQETFKKASQFFENWEEQRGLGNFAFEHKEIKFIVVDNVNRRKSPFGLPGAAGWSKLYPESKKWLMEQVMKSTERIIIIISHAPLKMKLLKQPEREKISAIKTMLAIAGHRHKYQITKRNEIVLLVTNALYVEPGFPVVTMTKNGTPVIEFQKL